MMLQRLAADRLGLTNPFYRSHDGLSGASAQVGGHPVANFSCYDYLGLNGHPEVVAAVTAATATWGTSVSASRITAGERPFHRDLERALAAVYGTEDCLVFVSGHATNVSTIATLVGPQDLILHDAAAHNSIVVGAKLAGAHRRLYGHNDLESLESILATSRDKYQRCLIVTEGLFSMDGDGIDLPRLVEIKQRYGAWLMVDEAHALGVLGETGRGSHEHAGLDGRAVDIWMGTLSKTLVSCGGYIAGSAELIEYLKFQSPGMVYSVGLSAPTAMASLTALEIMRREPERVARLRRNGQRFCARARAAGLDLGLTWEAAIVPVIVGDSLRTVVLASRLLDRGINAFPIIPPGVPEKSARLRFFVTADHPVEVIDRTVDVVAEELMRIEQEGLSVDDAMRLFS